MDITLLVMIVMLTLATIAALWKGRRQLIWAGLKQAGLTFKSMWLRILLGITLGGLIQVLIPSTLIAEWLGPASGLKGILIGSYVGLFLSGGPYVVLPIIAAIYQAGAGTGPIIALLAGGMLAMQALIAYDIPIVGLRLALSRYIICLIVPPIVGLAGGALFQVLNLA